MSSQAVSVCGESGLVCGSVAGWHQELWAFGDRTSDLGVLWGKLREMGACSRERAFISLPILPAELLWGRRRSDARIRFPNLSAFSVCARMGLPITDCYSLAGRDLFTSPWRGWCLLFSQLDLHCDNFWKMLYMLECVYVFLCVFAIKMVGLTERPIQAWKWQMWSRIGIAPGKTSVFPWFWFICVSLIKRILKISSLAPNIAWNLAEEFD